MASVLTLRHAVEAAGHRFTPERRAVAALIAAHADTFTPAELLAESRRQRLDIGRATLFRALELFGRVRRVERIDLPDGRHAYVACDSPHHHHLLCSSCGRNTEIGELDLSSHLIRLSDRTGYRVDRHRLALFGVCRDCQPRRSSEQRGTAKSEQRMGVHTS